MIRKRIRIAPNLYKQIQNNSECWLYRFYKDGKQHQYGLGSCRLVSESQAKLKALEWSKLRQQGYNLDDHRRI